METRATAETVRGTGRDSNRDRSGDGNGDENGNENAEGERKEDSSGTHHMIVIKAE